MLETEIEKLFTSLSVPALTKLDAQLKAGPLTFPFSKLEPHRVQIEECLSTFLAVEAFLQSVSSLSA